MTATLDRAPIDAILHRGRQLGRRPRHELISAPPGECNGPGTCLICHDLITMHVSGRCHRCGGWCAPIPASEVRPGDLVLDGQWGWFPVDAVSTDMFGRYELRLDRGTGEVPLERIKPLLIGPDGDVWVATNQRRGQL